VLGFKRVPISRYVSGKAVQQRLVGEEVLGRMARQVRLSQGGARPKATRVSRIGEGGCRQTGGTGRGAGSRATAGAYCLKP